MLRILTAVSCLPNGPALQTRHAQGLANLTGYSHSSFMKGVGARTRVYLYTV